LSHVRTIDISPACLEEYNIHHTYLLGQELMNTGYSSIGKQAVKSYQPQVPGVIVSYCQVLELAEFVKLQGAWLVLHKQ